MIQGQKNVASTPLQQLIIERISREGPISFAEYMRMALYEPGYGYYVTEPLKMGWEGDYYTSGDISGAAGIFANCLGRQLRQMWEHLKRPVPFIVLEQGAGRGDLAQGIRAWAQTQAPDFSTVLDYQTEDIRAGQDVVNASDKELTPSVILSNELIDAFPVHVVETHNGQLYEVYVDEQDGRLYEVLDEPSSPQVAAYLDNYKIHWQSFGDGWRAEINLDALRWMERTAYMLKRGFILTIDYGDKAAALYTRYRRRGTLACYFRHQMTERPLVRPGEQDITAHVNFTALINAGRQHGLRLNRFTTQRLWLEELGIYEELESRRKLEFSAADTERGTDRGQVALLKWYDLRQRALALTDPAGMGNFKVLILRR